MTSRKPSITNPSHSQTHGLGKVKGTKVIEAFDLSNAYYVLGPWMADGVIFVGQNHKYPDASFGGELLGQSNQKACLASRFTQRHPGPLALTQQSDMA